MSKRIEIEMIEEYIIQQSDDADYNPPSYIWTDNKGVLIRCKDCKHWYPDADAGMACKFTNIAQPEEGFCNWAERRK